METIEELKKRLQNDFHKVFPDELIDEYAGFRKNDIFNAITIYIDKDNYFLEYKGFRESENAVIKTNDYNVLLWEFKYPLIDEHASKYAMQHCVPPKNYRRLLFQKEIELMYLLSEDFGKKKEKEISQILEKYPYTDKE